MAGFAYFATLRGDDANPAASVAPKAAAGTIGAPQALPATAVATPTLEPVTPPTATTVAKPSSQAAPAAAEAPVQLPAGPPAAAATESPASVGKVETAASAVPVAASKLGPLTTDRLTAGQAWLKQLPDDRWFIQLFATDAARHAEVESLLRRLPSAGVEMDRVHVYYSELSGKPRYGVTYGNYPSAGAASAAAKGLPQVLRANKPYPRQAVRLR